MTETFKRHPLSVAMGEMEPESFLALQDSISVRGVLEPITIFEGMVLDGWNRYNAALGLGMTCPDRVFKGDYAEAADFVWDKHGTRRNWNASQRALAQANLMALRGGRAPVGRPANPAPGAEGENPAPRAPTIEQAAANAGVGVRTMERAVRVAEKGSDELKKAVMDGEVSLKQAESVVNLPPARQAKAVRAQESRPESRPEGAKKAKPAQDVPRPVVGASLDVLDELREKNAILTEEVERLEARVAVLAMDPAQADADERLAAAALIADLQAQLKTMRATHDALQAVHAETLAEKNELMRQCTTYRNQLKRLNVPA